MNRVLLALAAVVSVSACSKTGDRSVPVADQSDRPLQVARPDPTDTAGIDMASRGTQPVSPVEQQATSPEPATKARPAAHQRRPARPKPVADTSTRAYAPAPPDDTAATPARTSVPDSAVPEPDTVAPDTVAPDTVPNTAPDSAAMVTRDSSPSPIGTIPDSVSSTGFDDRAARTLPIGTEIHAALDDSISSRSDSAGRNVTAQVTESVTRADGKVLIPAGSTVRLTVTRLSSAKSKSSEGRFALNVDGIVLGGQLQTVQAEVRPVSRELRGRGVTGSEAAKVGVGAAGGAVLGRVIGGSSKGAVIGGVLGAAGGAVVANQTATRDVVVKARTPVTFVLTAPLVTP